MSVTAVEAGVVRCPRCIALGVRPPGIARKCGWCNWCCHMGAKDNQLRALKGMKVFP